MEKRRRQRRDPEVRLDQGVRALVGTEYQTYSKEDQHCLREQLRLTVLHPGQYVAFRDYFRGEGDTRRLVRREVLRASRSLAAVSKHVEALPEHERQTVYVDYVEPAEVRTRGR